VLRRAFFIGDVKSLNDKGNTGGALGERLAALIEHLKE
jgi:hypothetical protein